jgi:hypothetical protein
MERENFKKLLRALSHRKPFRSYTVDFVGRGHIEDDHPEALIVRAGVAVYLAADGTPAWFDHQGVSCINGEAPAGAQSASA